MDILLREVRVRADGVEEYHDTELTVDDVTVGSAPDRVIQLLGAGIAREHAEIRTSGDRIRISCERGCKVKVGDKEVGSITLTQGDRVELGGHRLDFIAPPAGFDLAIEIRRDTDVQSSAFEEAFQTHLHETWLGKRGPAWALLAIVLALTLAVPLVLALQSTDAETTDEPSTLSAARLAVAAKSLTVVPTDRLWSTGPLLPAHQLAIGDDCATCHKTLFERVQDDSCTKCHGTIRDHVTVERTQLLVLETHRCATCHLEHNEPPGLIVRADSLCTDCHADPDAWRPHAELDPVTGFALDTHPTFDAHLLKAVETDAGTGLVFDWQVRIQPVLGAEEESHLKFPHDVHLDDTRVQNPATGNPIGCADCHVLSPDQEHFLPITMEAHCRSCHDLKFDPDDPTRELPHGNTRDAILTIEGHFMSRFADPNATRREDTRRRRPDRDRESDNCTAGVFVCGKQRTEREAVNQFTRRGCVTCHDVNDSGSSDLTTRFQVYPVRLQSDYFPVARFDHTSHLTQRDASGDDACLTCHAADTAQSSDVLLIPDVDNCVECHGDTAVADKITLQCVDCHAYHPLRDRARPRPTVIEGGDEESPPPAL
jgi:hypothetical protein